MEKSILETQGWKGYVLITATANNTVFFLCQNAVCCFAERFKG